MKMSRQGGNRKRQTHFGCFQPNSRKVVGAKDMGSSNFTVEEIVCSDVLAMYH